jgi:hypothetical protein
MPERIAAFLHAVHTLLGYGRHLIETVEHRAAAPNFPTIAARFGTANLTLILARLQRGILRAVALEQYLLERAATGRDITLVPARCRRGKPKPAAADPAAEQPAAEPVAEADAAPEPPPAAPRPARRPDRDNPDGSFATLEELQAQVRRRPLGRSIIDICLDLAVMPGVCTGPFWNELFDIMNCYGGNLAGLMRERVRREEAFAKEQDRQPGSNSDWIGMPREAIRKVLGFFVGEEPVDPFARSVAPCVPAAAVATGPP